jgi:hypothetical protein
MRDTSILTTLLVVCVMLLMAAGAAWGASTSGDPVPGGKYDGITVTGSCMNFVHDWAANYNGTPIPSIGKYHLDMGAHWVWDDTSGPNGEDLLEPANTYRIANSGSNWPQKNDIIVWSSYYHPPEGHIAVVDSASSTTDVVVVESGSGGGDIRMLKSTGLNSLNGVDSQGHKYILGWFRKNGTTPPSSANVYFDPTAAGGGDGSSDHPLNDFATALATVTAGGTIHLRGSTTWKGTIDKAVTLVSEGGNFTIGT